MVGLKSFSLHPRHKFDNGAHYHRPKEIGFYSLDRNRQISYDKSQLRYLVNREAHNVHFDLMHGFERLIFNQYYFTKSLDHMLQWVVKHRDIFADRTRSHQTLATKNNSDKLSTLNTDFVVKRGCLSKILGSTYRTLIHWKFAVIRFKDTFYLCDIDCNLEDLHQEKLSIHTELKFRQYFTTDKPNGEADTSIPTNNCEAHYTIMKTNLNSHSLILSGEVDCVDDSDGKCVKFKMMKELVNPQNEDYFKRYKLLQYWAQSFLVGIPRIICGFRDDNVVQKLHEFNTEEIPNIVRDMSRPWNPNICVGFLDQFLTFIKKTIPVNDHRKVYVFQREPNAESITCQLFEEDSEFHFLPQWYIDEFQN